MQIRAFFFLAIFPCLLTAQRACRKPNEFLEGGVCKVCPAGTHRNFFREECTPCNPGTFRAIPGASSSRQCIFCPPNTFQDEEGSTSCKPCPTGTISQGFAIFCAAGCPRGQEYFGRIGCIDCLEGFFKPNTRLGECQKCPDGTVTDGPRSSSCTNCPPGQYRASAAVGIDPTSRDNECSTCQQGTFSKGGAKFCKLCPFGSVASKGASSCTPCPIGTFSNKLLSSKCRTCPTGTVAEQPGSAGCKKAGKCPSNTFEDSNGVCKMCHAGDRFDKTLKKCIRCGDDEISFGGVDTECTACPAGKQPIGGSSILERGGCVCKPGTIDDGFGGCTPCPAGSFWKNDDFRRSINNFRRRKDSPADLVGECRPCERGRFADKPGSLSCTRCPENTFARAEGSTTCEPCPAGFESLSFRSDMTKCVDRDLVCQKGEVRFGPKPSVGCRSTTCCRAKICMPPFFQTRGICTTCSAAERFVPRFNACFPCPSDTFSTGGMEENCRPCSDVLPNSEFSSKFLRCVCKEFYGGPSCESCEVGTAWGRLPNGDAKCFRCPAGTEIKLGTCEKCPKGRVSSAGGVCSKCPRGTKQVVDTVREPRNACRPK